VMLKEKIYSTLKQLVAVPSVSGTDGERHAAEKIYETIMDMPYFKEKDGKCLLEAIKDDPAGRCIVWAMVEGEEKSFDTVLLTAHLDVVDIEGYGHLQPVAFDMEECTKRIGELELDDEARRDLESGEWVF